MKVHLREITEQGTDLHFNQDESWVKQSVSAVDEPIDVPNPAKSLIRDRKISLDINLRKVDEVILVNGTILTQIQLLCSRCSGAFLKDSGGSFSTLFCRDPEMAGIAYLTKDGKPKGRNNGHSRHAHDWNLQADGDLDITYLADDTIDLASVVTEQLQLEVPFQPLCLESCKGICSQCGADLNHGRCACSKIKPSNPFAALQKLNVVPDKS